MLLIYCIVKLSVSSKICRITKKNHQNIAEYSFRAIENNYFGFKVMILYESAELLAVRKILTSVTLKEDWAFVKIRGHL